MNDTQIMYAQAANLCLDLHVTLSTQTNWDIYDEQNHLQYSYLSMLIHAL